MSSTLQGANGGSFCLTKAGLAIGSTTTNVATGAAAATVINGVFQTSRAADSAGKAFTAVSGYTLSPIPIGSSAIHALWVNGSGTFRFTQGLVAPAASSSEAAALPPNPGPDWAPVGAVKVFVGASAAGAFTPGTTALNATGVTATYVDLMTPLQSAF